MKISIDHVTNSSSESFGTAITDSILSIALGIPFIATTLGIANQGAAADETGGSADPSSPYPSTDPADPAGTVIQNNADGSTTKTLPDGTTGTKMPDGTVYVSAPDGTTGVITPDGHEKYTSTDGSTTDVYTDGTSYTILKDGATRTEYPDGTTRVTTPDGGMALQRPDGSFELKEPGHTNTQICDKDGNVVGVRDENGGVVIKDQNGNYTGKMITSDGMELDVSGHADSDVTLTNPNGTKIVMDKNGELKSGKIITEDGYTEISEDGHLKGTYTDKETGVKTEIESTDNGGLEIKDSKGTQVTVTESGIEGTIVSDKGTVTIRANGDVDSKGSDGSSDKVVNRPDGTASWTHQEPNGEVTTVDITKTGNYEISGPGGEKETLSTNPDGSVTLTQVGPDGSRTTYVSGTNGDVNISTPDGGNITVGKDGGVQMTGKNGETKTFSADEMNKINPALPGGANHDQ